MEMVGRGRSRVRRIAGLITLAGVGGVLLLIGASPVSADSTGIEISGTPTTIAREGGAPASFTVTRTGSDPLTDVTVTASITAGDADVETPSPASFTLSDANPSQVVTVAATNDTANEPLNEAFTLQLNPSVGANVIQAGAVVDNDVVVAVSDGQIVEGADPNTSTVQLTLDQPAPSDTTVTMLTADGTAAVGSDFFPPNARIIPAGSTQINVPLQTVADTVDEPNETFTLNIDQVSGAVQVADGTATVAIVDDDDGAQLSLSGPSTITEPASGGNTSLTYTVTLSPASGQTVTVNYATSNGTAQAGSDYTAASGQLSFGPGQTTRTFAVTVLGDAVNEPNETFAVSLGSPVNASVATGPLQVTITDANAPPTLGISDAVVNEGAGTVAVEVNKAGSTAQTVTVQYEGQTGSSFPGATLGADFTLTAGTLSFAPGETKKTITVTIVNDTTAEADETFQVVLKSPAPAGVTLVRATASVKIVDNDAGGTPPPSPPAGTPRPPVTNPPSPPPPTTTPRRPVKQLTARVVWARLIKPLQGRKRAAILVTLNQKVSVQLVMFQGKRVVRSKPFELRAGNRTVYVVLPKNVTKGRVNFQMLVTTATDLRKTLKTKLVLKA
jgi:hypothetical protein